MPDRRRHRGPHPDDSRLFAPERIAGLRAAADDYCWLLTRGYPRDASLKLIGDRHALTARQRLALQRACCSDQDRAARRARQRTACPGPLAIDGFNLLITLESSLSGGIVLFARDGSVRDFAGMAGTYRTVSETDAAIELLLDAIAALAPCAATLLLDRPVSNSGRLAERLRAAIAARAQDWSVEVVTDPDRALCLFDGAVVTSDSAVLDRCSAWLDLVGSAVRRIESSGGNVWRVEL